MQSQNLLYDQIYDLVAFRILVDSPRECYEALGVVHQHWKPIPGRFRDYIAMPKANMYQSLHTTVIGPYGERMEVQIRTPEMHRVAEAGIAAHWRYKGQTRRRRSRGGTSASPGCASSCEWQQHLEDPQEFMRSVKEDLFTEEVFAFTPKGDLFNFPQGATVIDFAYRVHSQVGEHCAGARVNGKLVPLKYQLQSGDTVEIITTTRQTPSKDWLKLVKTTPREGAHPQLDQVAATPPQRGGRCGDPRARPRPLPARARQAPQGRGARGRDQGARIQGRGITDRGDRLRTRADAAT